MANRFICESGLSPKKAQDVWESAKRDIERVYGLEEPIDDGSDESERFYRLAASRFRQRAEIESEDEDLSDVASALESAGLEDAAKVLQ